MHQFIYTYTPVAGIIDAIFREYVTNSVFVRYIRSPSSVIQLRSIKYKIADDRFPLAPSKTSHYVVNHHISLSDIRCASSRVRLRMTRDT